MQFFPERARRAPIAYGNAYLIVTDKCADSLANIVPLSLVDFGGIVGAARRYKAILDFTSYTQLLWERDFWGVWFEYSFCQSP